jgi:hypothetical protein
MATIFERMEALATCMCKALADVGLKDLCFCGVMPGDQIDTSYISNDCPGCGMAWVRLVSSYPSVSLGTPSTAVNNCGSQIGIELEVGALFCISPGETDGSPPSAEELFNATKRQADAAQAIFKAINCCDIGDSIIGTYVPFGPEGGGVGGAWPVALMDQ